MQARRLFVLAASLVSPFDSGSGDRCGNSASRCRVARHRPPQSSFPLFANKNTKWAEIRMSRTIQVDPDSTRSQEDLYLSVLAEWSDAAMSQAMVRAVGPDEFVATVAGLQGALGYGGSEQEALESLRSGLADWVHVQLEHGVDDIPVLGGINFHPS